MTTDSDSKELTNYKPPVVVGTSEIADFLQSLIRRSIPGSHLIVCAEEEDFLHQVLASISYIRNNDEAANDDDDPHIIVTSRGRRSTHRHPLLITTLRQLYNSRNISVTFCPSVDVLRAFLASYESTIPAAKRRKEPTNTTAAASESGSFLALLNPLALHQNTPNFSAQGLSRTIASAVDAAFAASQQLVIAECPSRVRTRHVYEHDEHEIQDASPPIGDEEEALDPWDEAIPLLNSTTRSFGAGSRAWAGRTVTARQVVARWCVFENWPAETADRYWYR